MGQVWVRAITIVSAMDKNGKQRQYHPGDWLQLGGHDARNYQAAGQVEILNHITQAQLIPADCGIVLKNETKFAYDGIGLAYGEPRLEFEKTLIWDNGLPFKKELIPVGFTLLDRWEIAAPIPDYNTLARDIGTEDDRKHTEEVIHDLRVPVYETRLMFIRRNDDTKKLLDLWQEERKGGDDRLAFLRALYLSKPYILALPSIWLA